ncbi:MAG: N-acetylneuraminate synthase family protein [Treponema sp.]|nr:N-acetylneuraminate synthase family protein [Treponema sp.]
MNKKPFIIAELGTSHGGDLIKARELVAAAAEAGADCIKCQIVFAGEILHPNTGTVGLPGGAIPLYLVFKGLEQEEEFYGEIKNEAEKLGICFLATPFGPKSAALLKKIGPKMVKIASPELNYTTLLEEIGSWGKPVYLSTGVSTLGDIETALEIIKIPRHDLTLLHCITAYPAPPEEYNLRVLPHLAGIFGLSVGISDHSPDPLLVPILGTAMGAAAIEKHFCLSRNDPGLDDAIALDPEDFSRMTSALRWAMSLEKARLIEEMQAEFGFGLVEKTLGSGIKALAPSEAASYGRTNRSIHALRDIAEGEIIEPAMIAVLRTEKNLRPGLHPRWERTIVGRKVQNPIPAGEGIRFEDI